LQTGHHRLSGGSVTTIGHGGSSATRGWSMSSTVASGARAEVVWVATKKKGSEGRAHLVSLVVSSASYNRGGKLWSCEEKVEGIVEVHKAGREKIEMEWHREMESAGKKKKKRGFTFWTLNKLYGLGSINNWGIWLVLAPVVCHPRPNMQVLCFESSQSRHMLDFGISFLSTEA